MPEVIVLGGPNGAGKTTAAAALLPRQLELLQFVNADEIAHGLSPFDAEAAAVAAGRLMIARMRALQRAGIDFAFETTCSGLTHAQFLRQCKADGWRVSLLFLCLRSPEVAINRVARRVRQGGHSVASGLIRRRYWRGLTNMRRVYLELADIASIYDNDDEGRILVAEKEPDTTLVVHDHARWSQIEEAAR